MNESQSLNNKLFLMYLIARLPGRTESDLVGLALRSLYLDYFTFSASYAHLSEQGLVYAGGKKDDPRLDARGRNEMRVYLSDQGQAVLAELEQDLPLAMRNTVEQLGAATKYEHELRETVLARYEPRPDGQYELDLRLLDGTNARMALQLCLPDEKLCQKVLRHWKMDALSLYTRILDWVADRAESEVQAAGGADVLGSSATSERPDGHESNERLHNEET